MSIKIVKDLVCNFDKHISWHPGRRKNIDKTHCEKDGVVLY